MSAAQKIIISEVKGILTEIGVEGQVPAVEIPQDLSHGDYSTNVALATFGNSKFKIQNLKFNTPLDLANELVSILNTKYKIQNTFSKVEAVKPGFINFWLSDEYLINSLIQKNGKKENLLAGKRILVEFAHPNTHKEFHIGHLRNIAIGESICRILEFEGAKVFRGNYQGDIGLHVAKAIYGIQDSRLKTQDLETKSLEEKIKALGEAYALGAKAYEEDESARKEIQEINASLYQKQDKYKEIWQKTRALSLEYFETIYKKLNTHFDRLFFESEVYEKGKEIVESHVEDGIFVKDQGAIIFSGEKFNLHKRVFVTKEGYATYEGKEMALAFLQYALFPFDLALHIVAQEQEGYFKVVFKALELIDNKFKNSEKHLSYGMVELKEGKMSSRQGNIISAFWLIDEAKKRIKKEFTEITEEVAEKVAVGAVKYSMLKFAKNSNISFSFDESISIQGNSGPYLQYAYARTQSVIRKAGIFNFKFSIFNLEPEEEAVLRQLIQFEGVVESAAENFSPNLICNYLFDLAQKFNLFYQKCQILKSEKEEFRLSLTSKTGEIIKAGLGLLGIEAPESM